VKTFKEYVSGQNGLLSESITGLSDLALLDIYATGGTGLLGRTAKKEAIRAELKKRGIDMDAYDKALNDAMPTFARMFKVA